MLIKITVFLLAITLILVLLNISPLQMGSWLMTWFKNLFRKDDRTVVESFDGLSVTELRNKLQKLERQLGIISNKFISMQPDRQEKAIDRIKEIKHEIEVLSNAIERTDKAQNKISNCPAIDTSLSEEDEVSSVINFAFRIPSASRWFYASRMHNGKHRTIQFGFTTNEPTHNSYIR